MFWGFLTFNAVICYNNKIIKWGKLNSMRLEVNPWEYVKNSYQIR